LDGGFVSLHRKTPYIAPAPQPHLVKLFYSICRSNIFVETKTLRRGIASRFLLEVLPQESGTLFDWSGLQVRRSLSIGIGLLLIIIIVATLTVSLRAQESTPENPATGTIQGTLRDDVGAPVEGARVLYSSSATDTKGLTRSGKDGTYVSEPVPPGVLCGARGGPRHAAGREQRDCRGGRGGHGRF